MALELALGGTSGRVEGSALDSRRCCGETQPGARSYPLLIVVDRCDHPETDIPVGLARSGAVGEADWIDER